MTGDEKDYKNAYETKLLMKFSKKAKIETCNFSYHRQVQSLKSNVAPSRLKSQNTEQ